MQMLTKDERKEITEKWRKTATDSGSAVLQIALLSAAITKLTEHFKTHKQDNNSKRGLFLKIARRKKLLTYLARTNKELHQKVVQELNI